MVMYFAYGSNMDKDRLKKRKIRIVSMMSGRLRGWKLIFNVRSGLYDGAAANIMRSAGSVVEGVVIETDGASMKRLDKFEEAPTLYHEETVSVETPMGKVDCITYVSDGHGNGGMAVGKSYMNHLLKGREFLSDDYVRMLEDVSTKNGL